MDNWEILGYVAAFFNPMPTGALAAYFLWKEGYTKTGKIVGAISVVWFIVAVSLTSLSV